MYLDHWDFLTCWIWDPSCCPWCSTMWLNIQFASTVLLFVWVLCNIYKSKCKGNVDLYSASLRLPLTRSDMDHIVLPANNTISDFSREHSRGGTTTHIRIANAWVQFITHLSTLKAWKVELAMPCDIQRTVYPEEVTRQLHVMTQATESSSVIDRRSNHWIGC